MIETLLIALIILAIVNIVLGLKISIDTKPQLKDVLTPQEKKKTLNDT